MDHSLGYGFNTSKGRFSSMMTGQKHILLVEDEPHLAFNMELNLQAEGYRITLAKDGREAVENARVLMLGANGVAGRFRCALQSRLVKFPPRTT